LGADVLSNWRVPVKRDPELCEEVFNFNGTPVSSSIAERKPPSPEIGRAVARLHETEAIPHPDSRWGELVPACAVLESETQLIILLVMTATPGIVDALSYLGLGHVFTANMTGNIVLMAFRLGGASGISLSRSVIALFCFMLGAVAGGRMGRRLNPRQSRISGLLVEAALFFVAAAISFKAGGPKDTNAAMLDGGVALYGDRDGSQERRCAEVGCCRSNHYGIDANDRRFGCGLRLRRRPQSTLAPPLRSSYLHVSRRRGRRRTASVLASRALVGVRRDGDGVCVYQI
jgi:hypothetical protein